MTKPGFNGYIIPPAQIKYIIYMSREQINTAKELASALGLRNEARKTSSEGLQKMLAEINRKAEQAEGELESYRMGNVALVVDLMQQAASQRNKEVVEFANTFAHYLLDGGDPESFFEGREHLRELELSGIIESLPGFQAELWSSPKSGPLLLGMGEIIEGEVTSVEEAIEETEIDTSIAEEPDLEEEKKEIPLVKKPKKEKTYIVDPDMTQGKKIGELTRIYPAIETLFQTDSLWEKDLLTEIENTSIDNITTLIIGNDWKGDYKLRNAKAALRTFVKKCSQVYFEEFKTESFGRTMPDHGKTTFLSEPEVVHLLWFMHKNLGETIKKTPYRITKEEMQDWPFDLRKKKAR